MIPLFNDWLALRKLLALLDAVLREHLLQASVLVIDDGSTVPSGPDFPGQAMFNALERVAILRLRRNLGHQRAIAIGLAYAAEKIRPGTVVLMDSDGEDDPRDVPRLLKKYQEEGAEKIIFAERTKRSESIAFRVLYALYKLLHYLLVGRTVRVGNFSVIPEKRLASLVAVSETWNHYAAAVFKSRQPLDTVPTRRARRLHGRSTMNLVSLVTHGLSAISVYSDTVGVRLLMMAFVLILMALLGLACVVALRFGTDLAIPGWATFSAGILLLVLLQAIMFLFVFSSMILGARQEATFLPLRDYPYFISSVTTAYEKRG